MNKKQFIAMWFGIIIICAMGLYPPWIDTLDWEGLHYQLPNNYSPLWEPPQYITFNVDYRTMPKEGGTRYRSTATYIDFTKLLIQWICVTLLTIGTIISLKEHKIKNSANYNFNL